MKKSRLIGCYNYTVILTYLGMIFSFIGLLLLFNENYKNSILLLMVAGFCDMFDGAIAATKKRTDFEKHFGIQIDSLCDLINFGMLPAVFSYKITEGNNITALIAVLYVLCGLIRLAFFNVQEYERQQQTDDARSEYLGLPITFSSMVMPLGYLLFEKVSFIDVEIFPILLLLMGLGFILKVKIRKPHFVGKMIVAIFGLIELMSLLFLAGVDLV